MRRRTFLKSVIAAVAVPSISIPKLITIPETIYTAKTVIFDARVAARIALGEWLSKIIEEDIIKALSGLS